MRKPTRIIHRWFGSEAKKNRRKSEVWRYEYEDGAVELIPYFGGYFCGGRPLPTPAGGMQVGMGILLWRKVGEPWREYFRGNCSQLRLVSCAANAESLAEAVACLSGHQACR
jgi:hypothetical protein